jgi:RecA/RadA recombinase
VLTGLFEQHGKTRKAAPVIQITMPELIHELALPDVQDMELPEATKELLLHGPGEDVGDRSGALHAAGVQLYSAGYDDATVLSIFAASQPVMDIALSHRRQDPERALAYLWVEHCQKAKPKAITRDSILSDFDDLTSDPEVAEQLKKSEDRFKLETTEEFIVRRKASWIIKNVIPNANLGVIYGASGSGKSFFAFEMAAAIARGIEWRGHKTTKSKVCWVAAEGQEDMRKRVAGYCLHHDVDPKELTNLYFVANAPNMMELTDARALVKQIRIQGEFDLVVMDTLAQVMPGGNENSGEDMGKVLGHCKEITRLTGAMVELIHHSGKDESRGARGWSGLRAACDFEFEVIRADEERVAIITKLKGGADGGEFGFRLETIVVGEDEDGDDETTCVVGFTDSSRSSVAVSQGPTGKTQKAIMDQFRTLADLDKDGAVTEHELAVVVAASRKFDPTPGKRDKRVDNAKRDIRAVISGGFLQMDAVGRLSLPSA